MPHDDSRFAKFFAKKLNKKIGHQKAKTLALENAKHPQIKRMHRQALGLA